MNTDQTISLTIQSFNDLISTLSEEERTNYAEILHSLSIDPAEVNSYHSWSDEKYTRNCVVENEAFELILICWEPGQSTPIHDHGGEKCWVYVMEGEIKETLYDRSSEGEPIVKRSTTSKAGDVSFISDVMGYHSLENATDSRVCTLHLYAKPIRNCNVYDKDSGEFSNHALTYDTVGHNQPD
ncbi:MAG: cysteine dioxygenase family protein [Crocinitomicaceae bacterium]|nr:cysteine dioxygenase family protein [Crocinitomicaceae bacterium]